MKKFTSKLFLTVMAMMAWVNADAQLFKSNGLTYDVISAEDKTVMLTYGDDYYKGDVVVPATVDYDNATYKVIEVGYLAFENCWGVKSITLPEGLLYIGSYSMKNCTSLTEITIPSSVKEIRECAFEGCSDLTTVTFKETGEKQMMSNLFNACDKLNRVNVSDMTSWFNLKFKNENSNPLAFAHNLYVNGEEFTELVIPEGVKTITGYAFNGCQSLKKITITEAVDTIGEYAFQGCSGVEEINIPGSVKSINRYAFRDCTGIKTLMLNEGIESICDYAFTGCNGIEDVAIPSSVTTMGESAFSRCEGLKTLKTGDNLKEIKNYTFQDCKALESVTIGANTETIGYNAFSYCAALTEISGGDNLMFIDPAAFNGTAWMDAQPDGIVYVGAVAYKFKGTMEENASVEIKEGTKVLGNDLFYMQNNLKEIKLPESLKTIGSWAFYKCDGLTTVVVPDGVETVGDFAFAYCAGLKTLTLGSSVKLVGDGLCDGSNAIFDVICNAPVPPVVNFSIWGGTQPFTQDVYSIALLTVPEGTIAAYEDDKTWSQFYYIEEGVPSSIETSMQHEAGVEVNNGAIEIKSAPSSVAEVYNVNGELVYRGTNKTINVPAGGLYIVKVAGRTVKVIL